MDARDDTTLNWMPMAVDLAGWAEVAAVFEAVTNRLEAIHELCRRRMEQNGEDPTALVVGMAAFEPAPNGFVPEVGAEMDSRLGALERNGADGDGVVDEESTPSA
jgi:hypothetical protein